MTLALTGAVLLIALSVGPLEAAPAPDSSPSFTFLPGSSQRTVGSLSASPDTAVFGAEVTPYALITAGVDFAFFELAWPEVSLRAGFAGMYQFEEDRPYRSDDFSVLMLPPPAVNLWRGQRGLGLAVALDGARRWLGERGLVEVAIGFQHESEHHTGDDDRVSEESRVMNVGDFIGYSVALRIPMERFDFDLRLKEKIFGESSGSFTTTYAYGASFDAIARWRLTSWLQPFTSFFGEHAWGNDFRRDGVVVSVPDAYLLRNLTGVVLPGRAGDLSVFMSASIGHGRGERAYQEEALWGGGVRFAFF